MPKLIDTNVMLAASAIHSDLSALVRDASPPDIDLRERVFRALREFDESAEVIVLDDEGLIRDEYERNMPFNQQMRSQEYGMLVLQVKIDMNRVNWVLIDVIEGNGERLGRIEPELGLIVTDREDHKWIAAANAHRELYSDMPSIVYGAESDWFHVEDQLAVHGYIFERLLPSEWYLNRH